MMPNFRNFNLKKKSGYKCAYCDFSMTPLLGDKGGTAARSDIFKTTLTTVAEFNPST